MESFDPQIIVHIIEVAAEVLIAFLGDENNYHSKSVGNYYVRKC